MYAHPCLNLGRKIPRTMRHLIHTNLLRRLKILKKCMPCKRRM
jgi:hypothetical protein